MRRPSSAWKKSRSQEQRAKLSQSVREIIRYLQDEGRGLSSYEICDLFSCSKSTLEGWVQGRHAPGLGFAARAIPTYNILYAFKKLPMQVIALWWEIEFKGVTLKQLLKADPLSPKDINKRLNKILKEIESCKFS